MEAQKHLVTSVKPDDSLTNGIAGPPGRQARRGAQISQLFDRLMHRTVFAQCNRIMRIDKNVGDLHQRCEAHRIARILHEDQKRSGKWTKAAMQQDAGIAAVALRLAERTDSSGYRDVAMRALSGYQPRDAWGPLAAGYLNVASQYLRLT